MLSPSENIFFMFDPEQLRAGGRGGEYEGRTKVMFLEIEGE